MWEGAEKDERGKTYIRECIWKKKKKGGRRHRRRRERKRREGEGRRGRK